MDHDIEIKNIGKKITSSEYKKCIYSNVHI